MKWTALLLAALAGCGTNASGSKTGPAGGALPARGGSVLSGGSPIAGATVILYATQPGGTSYGAAGVELARTTSDATGLFVLPSSACPAGQQAYLVAKGGTPSGAANPKALLLSALGDCANVDGSSTFAVNDVSTVAAAYALANFISISSSGDSDGSSLVSIGAPAAANPAPVSPSTVSQGACSTAPNGFISSCVTAGLRHGFQNALNLVNVLGTVASPPGGAAYSVPPANSAAEVPQALINTLGNLVHSCVGTGGGCAALFNLTTPPGGTAPGNTLQAMIDLAKNPTLNTAALFALQTATPNQPALSAAPADFSLAIVFKGTVLAGVTTPLGPTEALTLDADDNVYFSTSKPTLPDDAAGLAKMTSNGTTVFSTPLSPDFNAPLEMAADSKGNIWETNDSVVFTSGTGVNNQSVLQYSAATGGVPVSRPFANTIAFGGIAVDRNNNVWYAKLDNTDSSNSTLVELIAANGYAVASFTSVPSVASIASAVAIDASQNIWTVNDSSAGLLANTGTQASPAYAHASLSQGFAGSASGEQFAIDGSGTAWLGTFDSDDSNSLFSATPSSAAQPPAAFSISPQAAVAAPPGTIAVDGAGNIWIGLDDFDFKNANNGLALYVPGATPVSYRGLQPCRAGNGATTCGTTNDRATVNQSATALAILGPAAMRVDSAGDLWITSRPSSLLVEVIGTAAPTWPLLAYAHPGVLPQ
jgi:hypothetical protein